MQYTTPFSLLGETKAEISRILSNGVRNYISYTISKRSGARRVIDAPKDEIKCLQNLVLKTFINRFKVNGLAHGFVRHKSPITNATQHIAPKVLVKIDVKDFFTSIKIQEVYKTFLYLLRTELGRRIINLRDPVTNRDTTALEECADLFANIICYKGRLPQGAPTSPPISNIICLPLDRRLRDLEQPYKCTITRYADDITVSTKVNKNLAAIIGPILRDLRKSKLKVNPAKIAVIRNCNQMRVTGIVVNEKLNIDKVTRRNLRAEIHNIITTGKTLNTLEYQQLRGRVEWVNASNPQYGRQLIQRLGEIKSLNP